MQGLHRLALECSGARGSLALRSAEGALATASFDALAQGRQLLPELERSLRELGLAARELAAIVVGSGPGSYTGLRVAMASAIGLAKASGASLYALPSYEAVAWRELAPGESACFLADARAGALYRARFARSASDVTVLEPLHLVRREEFDPASLREARLFTERRLREEQALESERCGLLDGEAAPRASALLELAEARLAAGRLEPTSAPEPLYLRSFEAKPRAR